MKETVLVVDKAGRGSALVEGYARSIHVDQIFSLGDQGSLQDLTEKPVRTFPNIQTSDVPSILKICDEFKVSLVDVAQENAVQAGLTNALIREGIKVTGSTREAGQIEWSKIFARRLGERIGINQPEFWAFDSCEGGVEFIQRQRDRKWFVKADGLAEGKGALAAKNNKEAKLRVWDMRKFGDAGKRFLLEEWLEGDDGSEGEEFSSFYISDGKNVRFLGDAQDHKRAFNFDSGANTGGMGCSTPPLMMEEAGLREASEYMVVKKIEALGNLETEFRGIFYLGGMGVRRGGKVEPYEIEDNARWGDPEAEVLVPGIKSDLFELGMAVADGDISQVRIERDNKARVSVVGAARGYPGDYKVVLGKEVYGVKDVLGLGGVRFYGAGIRKEEDRYFANGGRLFHIVGEGDNVAEARSRAYGAMALMFIEGNNLHYRTDIGWRDVARLRE